MLTTCSMFTQKSVGDTDDRSRDFDRSVTDGGRVRELNKKKKNDGDLCFHILFRSAI